jgi:D-3-phosphoglycerate dehydrogenase / 2-oxoglutarate reductase
MNTRVLITDMHHASAVEEQRVLQPAGFEVATARCRTEAELLSWGNDFRAFLVSYAPISRRVMEANRSLACVVKYGIGVDTIDVAAATDLGVIVANVPDASVEEVAVHALTLILMGARSIREFADEVRSGTWAHDAEARLPVRLSEVDLGLVGFGRIARRLAEICRPLFRGIRVYDPNVSAAEIDGAHCIPCATLRDLFAASTVVSVHTPLTAATTGMIEREALAAASGIILVNTSRGGIIDRDAIFDAIDSGRVAFFGTDVLWHEPPDFNDPVISSLVCRRNVVVTPHIAWCSAPAARMLRRRAAEEVVRTLTGAIPRSPVNPEVLGTHQQLQRMNGPT